MKKRILFVIESLEVAGAEKSLISLLSLIDYSKYEVDLQLFSYGGELERLVPNDVNFLEKLDYMKFAEFTLKQAIIEGVFKFQMSYLISRLKFSLLIRRKELNNKIKARLLWEITEKNINKSKKTYDIAKAYAQGIPTFLQSSVKGAA